MKKRNPNIFFHLIDDENTLTEGICNLLSFDSVRRVFIEFLQSNLSRNVLTFDFENLTTQKDMGEEGRPDLICETDDLIMYIEIKANSWVKLTKNQPFGYLKSIHNQKKARKILIFILPDRYDQRDVIIERKKAFDLQFPDHDIEFEILLWSEFYKTLQESGLHQLNIVISQFSELLKEKFVSPILQFSKEEIGMIFSPEIPETVLKLEKAISSVLENVKTTQYRPIDEVSSSSPGFYLKNANDQKFIWFGLWYEFWRDHKSPIVAAVKKNWDRTVVENIEKKFKSEFQPYFENGKWDWYVYPLPRDYYYPFDINQITDWLIKIADELG